MFRGSLDAEQPFGSRDLPNLGKSLLGSRLSWRGVKTLSKCGLV